MEESKQKPAIKTPYRLLNIKERDLLFAIYEKWNGNIHAMIRDNNCQFRGKNQLYFYRDYYHFEEQLGRIRENLTREVIESLKDSKSLAVKRAIEIIQNKQSVLRNPLTGEPILDKDGQPIFADTRPTAKDIKIAWEIIKTEMGEPTQISKGDLTSGGKPIQANQITFENFKKQDESNS